MFPLASLADSFTFCLCELTGSRYSMENQRLFVLGDWLVSLSTMSMVSNHLRERACATFFGLVAWCYSIACTCHVAMSISLSVTFMLPPRVTF